jgi:hypothetical protein
MRDEKAEEPGEIPFDPVAYAEKWFEDHPESLNYMVGSYKRPQNQQRSPQD